MANLMVGRELSRPVSAAAMPRADARRRRCCAVRGLQRAGLGARTSSFEVRPGEILGFAGLVGAGRTELFEGLLGLAAAPAAARRDRRPAGAAPQRRARPPTHGLTYLSEDRKGKGLHVDFGLRENLTLMALERYAQAVARPRRRARRAGRGGRSDFGIRTGDLTMRGLVAVGRQPAEARAGQGAAAASRKVVVLDEPTRGVDVGAKRDIYFLIQRLAREGLRRDRRSRPS